MTDIGDDEAAEVLLWLARNEFDLRSRIGGTDEGFGHEYSTTDRLAWVTSSLRSETYDALANTLRSAHA